MRPSNCFHKLFGCILAVFFCGQVRSQDIIQFESSFSHDFGSFINSKFENLNDSVVKNPIKPKSVILVSAIHGLGYVGSIAALASVWYKDFDKTKLHAFNDMDEWGGMDKVGHANTAWQLSNFSYTTYRMTGIPQKKAAWIGSGFSMLYLTTLEFFDGYSADWGFSFGDMGANLTGSALAYFRNVGKLKNVHFKWSYFTTDYPQYRSEVLGKQWYEEVLKDYNGQKYWLSYNMPSNWFKKPERNWLCFSIGYSIDGYTGGKQNYFDESVVNPPDLNRVSEFYLSLDIDFSKFDIRSKFLRSIVKVFNVIKIPAPAIGINTNGKFQAHAFYF